MSAVQFPGASLKVIGDLKPRAFIATVGEVFAVFGVTRPSQAIRAMVEGIRDVLKDNNLTLDMTTFGNRLHDACFGCAATCALQKLSGVRLRDVTLVKEERSQVTWRAAMLKGTVAADAATVLLERLETWYDGLRHGGWGANDRITTWVNRRLPEHVYEALMQLPKLTDDLTEVEIDMYEKAATMLEAEDL